MLHTVHHCFTVLKDLYSTRLRTTVHHCCWCGVIRRFAPRHLVTPKPPAPLKAKPSHWLSESTTTTGSNTPHRTTASRAESEWWLGERWAAAATAKAAHNQVETCARDARHESASLDEEKPYQHQQPPPPPAPAPDERPETPRDLPIQTPKSRLKPVILLPIAHFYTPLPERYAKRICSKATANRINALNLAVQINKFFQSRWKSKLTQRRFEFRLSNT